MSKTFVIGDIHGCHQTLLELWSKISVTEEDTVVFLGDYIDRGPDSRQVVDEIMAIKKRLPRVITLMGNHEQMLLHFLEGREEGPFLEVGGAETLASYGIVPGRSDCAGVPRAHLDFFRELIPLWQNQEAIYVHAGLMPGRPLALQPKAWLFWAREEFLESDYDFGKPVVFGHTPFPRPHVGKHRIGIDTGAVYGGHLTCLILPDMEFVQAKGAGYCSCPFI